MSKIGKFTGITIWGKTATDQPLRIGTGSNKGTIPLSCNYWPYIQSGGSGYEGLGGKFNVIWASSHLDKVYELDTSDFSVIRQDDSPNNSPEGSGGNNNTFWHCDLSGDGHLYELGISDFSVIRENNPPTDYPMGVGGTGSILWHSETLNDRVYELDTNDFSVIRSDKSVGYNGNPNGVGGDSSTIWCCSQYTRKAYELSSSDLSIIRSYSSPSSMYGAGGSSDRFWGTGNEVYRFAVEWEDKKPWRFGDHLDTRYGLNITKA